MSLVLQVNHRIPPERVERFMAQLLGNARASRAESGCRQFEVLVDPEDATRVMPFEIYDDETAFEAHQRTPHFGTYLAGRVPLLAGRERKFWKRAP